MKKRTVRIPNVLADTDPHRRIAELEYRRCGSRAKVAKLVKDAVVRQKHLVIDEDELAVVDYRGGIEDIVFPIHETDHGSYRGSAGNHALQSRKVRVDELRFQQQVFWGIPSQRQLWKCDNVGVKTSGAFDPF